MERRKGHRKIGMAIRSLFYLYRLQNRRFVISHVDFVRCPVGPVEERNLRRQKMENGQVENEQTFFKKILPQIVKW